jgi:hypothetical protein
VDVRKLTLLMIVLAALMGCSEDPDEVPSAEDPSTGTDTDERANPSSGGQLLTFTRSGGFAGTTETITIGSGGRVEIESDAAPSQELTIPPDLVNRLQEELKSLDWARAANEPPNVDCADCFTYDIRAGGQRVTTTAMGESGEELRDLIALVDEIPRSNAD